LKSTPLILGAGLAFLAMLLFDLPFPLVVIAAGLLGAALLAAPSVPADDRALPVPRTGETLRIIIAWLAIWWAPVAVAALLLGPGHVLVDLGVFFSKLAVLTFGGAYAVLAWLAQAGVEQGWVTPLEMIDGLGLAETTPGPTILVNQFVAFLAALRAPDGLSPFVAASLGAVIATWVTFAPSFLWIFAAAPHVEAFHRNARVAGALTGITAAVVGVIAYIALWFALHLFFGEVETVSFGPFRLPLVEVARLDLEAAALALTALILIFGMKLGVMKSLAIMAMLGVMLRLIGAAP
jgi:chromate transporter